MNILITGGTGLIGRALILALFKRDSVINIVVLSRSADKVKQLFGDSVKTITCLSLAEIEQQDIVINLAGEAIADKRWTKTQKETICQSRWQITEQLAQLINSAQSPPGLFISGSAIGIYGRQSSQPIDEDFNDFHQEFSHEICAQWETLALHAETDNTRVCLLRTGIVLDKKGGALGKMLLPFKMGLGGYMASGEQVMSWIHIDDMCSAIIHIIENESLKGAINMVSPNPSTNKVFSQTLSHTLSRPCLLNTPSFMLKLIFGEMAELFIYGQHVVPAKLINTGFSFQFSDLDSALVDLINKKTINEN